MSTKSEKCIKYAKLWIAILVFLYVLVYSANRTLLIYKCRIYEVKASLSDVIYSGGNINSTSDNKCKFDETINISDGANNGTHIIFDEVAYSPKDYYEDAGKTYGCICNVRACIKPCCIQSERYESTPISVYREDKFVRDVNFSHFHKLNCSLHNPEKTYELDPNSFGCQQFHVQEDGRIYIPTRSAYKDQPMFCIRNVGNRYVVDEIARSFVNLSELFKFKVFGKPNSFKLFVISCVPHFRQNGDDTVSSSNSSGLRFVAGKTKFSRQMSNGICGHVSFVVYLRNSQICVENYRTLYNGLGNIRYL